MVTKEETLIVYVHASTSALLAAIQAKSNWKKKICNTEETVLLKELQYNTDLF